MEVSSNVYRSLEKEKGSIALHKTESEYRANKAGRSECDLRSKLKVGKSYYQCRVTGMFSSFQSLNIKRTPREINRRKRTNKARFCRADRQEAQECRAAMYIYTTCKTKDKRKR